MKIVEDKIYKLKEAAECLCVSRSTLRSWDRQQHFVAGRTKGGHRVYIGKQIIDMQKKMFEIRNE